MEDNSLLTCERGFGKQTGVRTIVMGSMGVSGVNRMGQGREAQASKG